MASARRIATLVPRRGAELDEARAAWDAGEYERLIRVLTSARFERREDRVASAVMRARALLAVGRPEAVGDTFEAVRKDIKGAEETVLVQMLTGSALTRIDRRDKGETMLEEAAALAARSAPAIAPEVAYYRALSRWGAHQLAEAEEIVERALPQATDVVRSRLLQLLGWIDIRRENYGAAAHEFTAALDELDKAKRADVKGRASILHALGGIAAETIDLRLGRLVRREYEANTWSEDTRIERFQVLEQLSWLSLLSGDVARAWDERQFALTLTIDTSYHAIALIFVAQASGIVGDRFSEMRSLDLAGALLLRGDQVALDIERRIALLTFAANAREPQLETARQLLTLYDRSRPRRTEMLALEGDRRVDASEEFARGRVAMLGGESKQGVLHLEHSLDLWTRLNYRMRIALTANELRLATGDRRYANVALDALRNAPDAWLRPALEPRAAEADPLAQLTPAERRVLAALCKGKKSREIADEFGRSFNTINNHTRGVFAAFGVRSRAALVAECARLGILDEIAALK